MSKFKFKNISLKWKIFCFLIGFCALLIVLLWLMQTVFLESFYKQIKISEVKSGASSIIKNINSDDIATVVENVAEHYDICVEITDSEANQLYSADILRECLVHKMPTFEKQDLIQNTQNAGGELLQYYTRPSGGGIFKGQGQSQPQNHLGLDFAERKSESIIYSKTLSNGSVLIINSLISPVNATVKTIRIQLYCITAVMILASVLLAIIIAKRVSKPIENINNSAKRLALGDYKVPFDGKGYREINELSHTLSYAAYELSKADSLQKELIANISHDLKTPLTLIGGYAEAMRDLPGESTPENAQIIIDETQRLTTLVNDVLDISKIQSGVLPLNLTDFNITEELESVVKRISELVRKDGYTITFEYDEQVTVCADKVRIGQAIYNLVINAINYTGEDKCVNVRQSVVGDKVKIEVSDSGEGISDENLKNIWDRYYKVDKTHKRAVTGTGLGLSIVKSVIEQHGGEYGVVSGEKKGSTFWFLINKK